MLFGVYVDMRNERSIRLYGCVVVRRRERMYCSLLLNEVGNDTFSNYSIVLSHVDEESA